MSDAPVEVRGEHRPDSSLLVYYVFQSLLLGPFFFFLLVPRWFKFRTLNYRFDEEGIAVSWGVLFHREVSLTFARIQDIHLASNLLERWLGLARVQIQTAAGSASAEVTIEGLPFYEAVRDFLYARMRGARGGAPTARGAIAPSRGGAAAAPTGTTGREVDGTDLAAAAAALREAAAELRELAESLAARRAGESAARSGEPPS